MEELEKTVFPSMLKVHNCRHFLVSLNFAPSCLILTNSPFPPLPHHTCMNDTNDSVDNTYHFIGVF